MLSSCFNAYVLLKMLEHSVLVTIYIYSKQLPDFARLCAAQYILCTFIFIMKNCAAHNFYLLTVVMFFHCFGNSVTLQLG